MDGLADSEHVYVVFILRVCIAVHAMDLHCPIHCSSYAFKSVGLLFSQWGTN